MKQGVPFNIGGDLKPEEIAKIVRIAQARGELPSRLVALVVSEWLEDTPEPPQHRGQLQQVAHLPG